MESLEKGKAALISSIETDAHAEEQAIIKDAEKRAAEKIQYAQKKVESILANARGKANEQVDTVKRKITSGTELEIKRRSLRVRGAVMLDILERVEKKLNSMTSDPSYRSVLINWIIEAAIGLDVDSAQVSVSSKELSLINDQLLEEVKAKIKAQVGKQMTFTLSNTVPLKSQGVVLTAVDGRVAFNNQVKTRLVRNQRKIQTLIYDALFAGN